MKVEERGTSIDSPQPDVVLPLQHLWVKIPECKDPDIYPGVRPRHCEWVHLGPDLRACLSGFKRVCSRRAPGRLVERREAGHWQDHERDHGPAVVEGGPSQSYEGRTEVTRSISMAWTAWCKPASTARGGARSGHLIVNSNANGGAVAVNTSMRRERKAPACATCMMIWYDMGYNDMCDWVRYNWNVYSNKWQINVKFAMLCNQMYVVKLFKNE
jgi:hypothetical protein